MTDIIVNVTDAADLLPDGHDWMLIQHQEGRVLAYRDGSLSGELVAMIRTAMHGPPLAKAG